MLKNYKIKNSNPNFKCIYMRNFKKFIKIITASVMLIASWQNASAVSPVAIGPKIGLSGLGLEARVNLADNLYGRLGVNYFTYSFTTKDSALQYKASLTLLTAPLMLDYHPVDGSGFKVSVGIAYNGNKIESKSSPASDLTLYDQIYTPKAVGSVKGTLEFKNKIAPILSVGYDSSLMDISPWSFNAEVGLMYSGKAKLKVSANGLAASVPRFINDLQKDADKGLDSINKYLKYFPVLSIGIKFSI